MILGVALRVLPAFALIAALDYLWQWRRHEKSIRMSKDDVKQEARESDLAPELRGAIRRRQLERARKRMLAAVPTADVGNLGTAKLFSITGLSVTQATSSSTGPIFNQIDATVPFDSK